ncbi:MAG TPA: M56 family metallopeptidase [Candidatus Polarisedimenticolaceae bacterium]|nr:M56 family metallopeptidase [Candidatus Polarisedimenticolaceae bacterium]
MSLLRISLEGAALAGLVVAACFLVPRMKASHKAMLWWLVAAKLLVGLLPIPAIEVAALPGPVVVPVAAVATALAPIEVLRGAVPAPARTVDIAWGMWIWIAGSALLLACAVPGWLQARDWRRAGKPIDDPDVALSVSRAARIVGLTREPRVLAVAGLPGPLVTGLLHPCVLLPAETLSRFRPEELEMTLAHEMAHIARGDLWWGLVPALARRLFFFHPAAWIAEREYAVAREAACDEAVLRPGADAFVYGQLLLRFASRAPSSVSIPMSPHRMLRRRLEMIESIVRRVPLSRAGWVLVGLAALTMIPVRLVAEETRAAVGRLSDEETHCLDIGKDEETAYVITNGKSHAMCGDVSDVRDAEAARGGGGDVIWFRVGKERWVIRDPETVALGRRYFRAITEIGQRQTEIGIEQSKIGMEQSRIGMEQSRIGMEQTEKARRELEETMRKAELDAARQEEKVQLNDQDRKQLERELQAAHAAREKASVDMERDRERLEEQMRVLSQRMEELGERQGDFGEKQRQLGERMQREMTETQHALSEFLEGAIKDGRATRTP